MINGALRHCSKGRRMLRAPEKGQKSDVAINNLGLLGEGSVEKIEWAHPLNECFVQNMEDLI